LWGCEGFLPEFPQTCPKEFWATFSGNNFSWRLFLGWPPKNALLVILHMLGVISFKSKHVGRHFCPFLEGFCKGFHRFCPNFCGFFSNFQGFCPAFPPIKTFGGALAPPPPTPPVAKESTRFRVGHFIRNLHSLTSCIRQYKLILRLAGVFGFLPMSLLLNKFAQRWDRLRYL